MLDVATVLNLIGVLTTPPLSGGASLSELWAFVRYFFAITADNDLRLTQDFLDMDPHQKTILSDDFGMGFTMHWISDKLNVVAVCDGRYFIENHLSQVGGLYSGGTGKKGLGKSPDFIAFDVSGKFHVIECKGTQTSINYRNSQLRNSGDAQKRTILFPAQIAGERLCAGIYIAGPDGDRTSMRIIDPDPPIEYKVESDGAEASRSAVAQGFLAKQLRSAGFARASAAVAYPKRRRSIEAVEVPVESVEAAENRWEASVSELSSLDGRTFQANGRQFAGKTAVIQLPRPIVTMRGEYSIVEVRRGIARSTFDQVRRRSAERTYLNIDEVADFEGKLTFGERLGRSWIMRGNSYYSDIRLYR